MSTHPRRSAAPGSGAGRLAVLQDQRAVDEHVLDALGQGPAGGVGRRSITAAGSKTAISATKPGRIRPRSVRRNRRAAWVARWVTASGQE